jgi:hypothetical protein
MQLLCQTQFQVLQEDRAGLIDMCALLPFFSRACHECPVTGALFCKTKRVEKSPAQCVNVIIDGPQTVAGTN